jgi:hypothetical protein
MVKKPVPWAEQMRTDSTRVAPLAGRSTAWEHVGARHEAMIAAQAVDPVRITRNTSMVVPLSLARPSQESL